MSRRRDEVERVLVAARRASPEVLDPPDEAAWDALVDETARALAEDPVAHLTLAEARAVTRLARLVGGAAGLLTHGTPELRRRLELAAVAHEDPSLCGFAFAVHVDGGRELLGGVPLPAYRDPERACRLAAALRAADPDALVTVVVFTDAVGEALEDERDGD